jgi:hypothetical protein
MKDPIAFIICRINNAILFRAPSPKTEHLDQIPSKRIPESCLLHFNTNTFLIHRGSRPFIIQYYLVHIIHISYSIQEPADS